MEFNRKIITFLDEWYGRKDRQPLILRGARQVGKTMAVSLFCKKNNINLVHLNLEKLEERQFFDHEVSLAEFKKILEFNLKKSLDAPNTLLFIDEIQEVPFLLPLLRFFYEDWPSLPVIAAGSLLEVKLKYEHLSMPVGRVTFAHMYPLDFFEFLEATGNHGALKTIQEFDFSEKFSLGFHESLMRLFNEYALIGGMPEAVKVYAETKNMIKVNDVYSKQFITFIDDVHKYTNVIQAKCVSFVLSKAPYVASELISFDRFWNSEYKSREISDSFEVLSEAMLLNFARGTKSTDLPIMASYKKPPKVIFLDTGLVNFLRGIQNEFINLKDLNSLYRGKIAEQIVGEELISENLIFPQHIFYWFAGAGFESELDFCLTHRNKIVGFEVKSGVAGKMKSAQIFLKKTGERGRVLRVYSGEFRREKNFVSLPFYLLPRWKEAIS